MDREIGNAKQLTRDCNPHQRWEAIKLAIIFNAQEYSRCRASNMKLILAQLEEAIEKLETKPVSTKSEIDLLVRTKEDYNKLIQDKVAGIAFRAGCK